MRTLMSLLMAACLAACARGGATPEQRKALAAAEATWNAQRLSAYHYDLEGLGFGQQGTFLVTARNGTVTSVPDSGNENPNAPLSGAKPISGLFDVIRANFDDDRIITTVTYHPTLGYPMRAFFDSGEEGDGFSVTNLQAE